MRRDISVNGERTIISITTKPDSSQDQATAYTCEFNHPWTEAPDILSQAYLQVLDAKLKLVKTSQEMATVIKLLEEVMREYKQINDKNSLIFGGIVAAETSLDKKYEEKYKQYELTNIPKKLGQLGHLDRPERKALTERLAQLLLENLEEERTAIFKRRIWDHQDKSTQNQLLQLKEDLTWLKKLFMHYLHYPSESKKSFLPSYFFKPISTHEKIQTVQQLIDLVNICLLNEHKLIEIDFTEFKKASGIEELKNPIEKLKQLSHTHKRVGDYIFYCRYPEFGHSFFGDIIKAMRNEINNHLSLEEQKALTENTQHGNFYLNTNAFDADLREILKEWLQHKINILKKNITPDDILAKLDELDAFWEGKAEFSKDNIFKAKYALLYSLLTPHENVMQWEIPSDSEFEPIPDQAIVDDVFSNTESDHAFSPS